MIGNAVQVVAGIRGPVHGNYRTDEPIVLGVGITGCRFGQCRNAGSTHHDGSRSLGVGQEISTGLVNSNLHRHFSAGWRSQADFKLRTLTFGNVQVTRRDDGNPWPVVVQYRGGCRTGDNSVIAVRLDPDRN